MSVYKYCMIHTPWKHEIIDNFLDQSDFDFLSNVNLNTPSLTGVEFSKNKVWKNKSESAGLPEKFLRSFYNRYFHRCVNILRQHAPERAGSVQFMELNVVDTGKHFEFPVHWDSKTKLLSCVVYLQPEHNIGTIMYETKHGDEVSRCDWKQNRCFIFARNSNTWHSYKSDGVNSRRTLVLNLRGPKFR